MCRHQHAWSSLSGSLLVRSTKWNDVNLGSLSKLKPCFYPPLCCPFKETEIHMFDIISLASTRKILKRISQASNPTQARYVKKLINTGVARIPRRINQIINRGTKLSSSLKFHHCCIEIQEPKKHQLGISDKNMFFFFLRKQADRSCTVHVLIEQEFRQKCSQTCKCFTYRK